MINVAEAEKSKNELTEKMNLVSTSINEKQNELESLKRSNARLVEASLSRKRMPGSLQAQRQQISKLTQEIEELEFAKGSIEGKLSKAKEDIRFAQIFEQVKVFKESEETFFNGINEIAGCMSNIAEALETYKKKVEQLKTTGHPLHLLVPILRDLKGKVSYENFFSNGELAKPDLRDNTFIDATIHRYRNIKNDLPGLDDLNMIGSVLWNQLSHISAKAVELRSFKNQQQ